MMRLFPVGPTFGDHPQVFSQKGPASWILFSTPAARPLQVTFSAGEAEHLCLYPFAWANVSSAVQAFHGGIFLLVITFVISELEHQEKNEQCGRDIIVPIRIDMSGVTSLQTNPNPATCVQKVLEQIPFLMSDLCKSSIVTVQEILVPNLVNSCKKPYPLTQTLVCFSWGLTYIYDRMNSPPMNNVTKLSSCCQTFVRQRNMILNQNVFPGLEGTHGCSTYANP